MDLLAVPTVTHDMFILPFVRWFSEAKSKEQVSILSVSHGERMLLEPHGAGNIAGSCQHSWKLPAALNPLTLFFIGCGDTPHKLH